MKKIAVRNKTIRSKTLYFNQGDSNTDILCFIIQRYCNGVDLSQQNAAILVSRGGNIESEADKILAGVDDVLKLEVAEETVKLIWTVSGHTTKDTGNLLYQIIFYDDQNRIVWHTTTATIAVRASLVGIDEVIYVQYPSLLQQWEANMREQAEDSRKAITQAQEQAALSRTCAVQSEESAKRSQAGAGVSTEQAQSASLNKDVTDQNKTTTVQKAQEAEQAKQAALIAQSRCEEAEQRVFWMMSTDTRSYLFKTIAERDAFQDLRHCDRCSVMETRSDYIYDANDTDGDGENPEWIQTSSWDTIEGMTWDIIKGKPNFAVVATSGSYNDLSDRPNQYQSFITLQPGQVWDYSQSDKAVITVTESTAISLSNLYNGAVGLIKVYGGELILPAGSKKSVDFDYVTAQDGGHYTYTFVYDGTSLCWARTVSVNV